MFESFRAFQPHAVSGPPSGGLPRCRHTHAPSPAGGIGWSSVYRLRVTAHVGGPSVAWWRDRGTSQSFSSLICEIQQSTLSRVIRIRINQKSAPNSNNDAVIMACQSKKSTKSFFIFLELLTAQIPAEE